MSIDMEMEEILNLFFEESFEGLDAMESGLLTMEDAADKETINTIFRAAHSIKGGAGTFGFMEISGFTHSVETLLDEMRNGARGVTPDAVQVLLQSVDVIREMIQSAQAKQPIVMTGANALSGELARVLAQKGTPVAPGAGGESPASHAPSSPPPPGGDRGCRPGHQRSTAGEAREFTDQRHIGRLAHRLRSGLEPVQDLQRSHADLR